MNRGQLEEIASRLYMLAKRNRTLKKNRAMELREIKIRVTKWSEKTLIENIDYMITHLETM